MLRVLLSRRWVAWLIVAVVASISCFFLGRWQWHRWESRHASQDTVKQNYDASPVPLSTVLRQRSSAVPATTAWRQVRMTGTYLTQDQTLVRNRPLDGTYGYQVLVPFRLSDGSAVIVDRGWVPNGPSANQPPPIPAAPSGTVTVLGWVRPAEPDLERSPVPGQVSSIHPPLVQARTSAQLYQQGYVRMRTEAPAPAERPAPLGKPDLGTGAGVNLSYAIQWWLGMVAFPLLVVLSARRELPSAQAARAAREKGPRKQRIWDEEDA